MGEQFTIITMASDGLGYTGDIDTLQRLGSESAARREAISLANTSDLDVHLFRGHIDRLIDERYVETYAVGIGWIQSNPTPTGCSCSNPHCQA